MMMRGLRAASSGSGEDWDVDRVLHLSRQECLGHQKGFQLLSGSVDDWKVSYFAFCEPSQLHALVSKKRYKDVT